MTLQEYIEETPRGSYYENVYDLSSYKEWCSNALGSRFNREDY